MKKTLCLCCAQEECSCKIGQHAGFLHCLLHHYCLCPDCDACFGKYCERCQGWGVLIAEVEANRIEVEVQP